MRGHGRRGIKRGFAALEPVRGLIGWTLLVALVAAVGAAGYVVLEGWDWFDALYMAVITLATVGFKEVHPMDRAGEIWTMILSVAAVGVIFGTVGVVAESMIQRFNSGEREAKRMQKRIDALHGHAIVCGYGRVGSHVAKELRADGLDVVVLDPDASSLMRANDDAFLTVPGDGTSDEVLGRAGVERAAVLVSCIDSDANNVYVTLTARSLNPALHIVGRASSRSVMNKLLQAGADRAVSPYVMAGRRIVELTLRPGVVDFIDAALSRRELEFSIEELNVSSDGPLVGLTVGELRYRGVFVLAIVPEPGRYEPTPDDTLVLHEGAHLIVSGGSEALRALDVEA